MAGYTHDLKRLLRDAGCSFVRHGSGDPEIWYSPKTETHFPVDSNIKSRHMANKTPKDAGLPKHF